MKKILALILALLLVVGTFAACDSSEKETDAPKDEQSEVEESEAKKESEKEKESNEKESESDEKESNTEDGGNTENGGNTEDGGSENEGTEEEPLVESTAGLEFELNADGKSYTLVGIGTCTATEIVIDGYNGLPVTRIGGRAFENCDSLTSVTIGSSVTSIGYEAFYHCSNLTSITVDESNKAYKSIDGNLYSKKTLIQYAIGKTDTSFVIPDSVTYIRDWAFAYCDNLTSVTIPNSVTSIGYSAFYYCDSLTSVTIGNSVTSIGSWAFYNCDKLVEVINKSSLTLDLGSTSNGYVAYDALEIHDGESKIVNKNGYLFYTHGETNYLLGYTGTSTELTLPKNYNGENYEIYEHSFCENNKITKVTIPDSVTYIGDSAFSGCSSLTSITIPNSVTGIGGGAFVSCDKLIEVINKSSRTFTKGSTSNGYVACYALEIHDRESKIVNENGYLFYTHGETNYLLGYTGTSTELTLPANYNGKNYEIYKYLFYNNDKITKVIIPDSVTSIGDSAFEDCDILTSITIPDSVTRIGESAFRDCDSLTSVTIGNSVTSIGSYAFYDCSGLTSIKYRGTKEQWNAISKGSNWNKYSSNGKSYTIRYTITYNYTGE